MGPLTTNRHAPQRAPSLAALLGILPVPHARTAGSLDRLRRMDGTELALLPVSLGRPPCCRTRLVKDAEACQSGELRSDLEVLEAKSTFDRLALVVLRD